MKIYELNNIKCIWIKPGHLHFVSKVIKDGLEKYGYDIKRPPRVKSPKLSSFKRITKKYLMEITSFIFFFTRCPSCKKPLARRCIRRELIGEEQKPWRRKIKVRCLNPNGSYKTTEEWCERMERIKIFKITYRCKYCGHEWSKEKKKNIDKYTRPRRIKYDE